MQPSEGLTPQEQEIEAALGDLRTAPHRLTPERLLFAAGQRSAHRRLWMWRSAAALLLAGLGLSLALRPQPSERVVYVMRETPAPTYATVARASVPGELSYLRIRDRLLEGDAEVSRPAERPAPASQTEPTLRAIWRSGAEADQL
jgi:hypothetical protein